MKTRKLLYVILPLLAFVLVACGDFFNGEVTEEIEQEGVMQDDFIMEEDDSIMEEDRTWDEMEQETDEQEDPVEMEELDTIY